MSDDQENVKQPGPEKPTHIAGDLSKLNNQDYARKVGEWLKYRKQLQRYDRDLEREANRQARISNQGAK